VKWLNYNHLYYFWVVAREGGVARAAEELMVSQPTVSVQLKELERSVGQRLFDRGGGGRGLQLTDAGRIAFNYANEIFSLAQEMTDALEHQPAGRPIKLSVGVLDAIPKPVVRRLLQPALDLPQPVRLICREDKADRLLADLVARRTDVVLSDAPIGNAAHVEGFNHLLGESDVSFFAGRELAAELKRGFPKSLSRAPVLLPTDHTQLRRSLNQWFDARRIHPVVAGEFDDSALMFWFGQAGAGAFPASSIMESRVQRALGVRLIGRVPNVRERYYAISREAKLKHPAVVAICETARKVLSGV
jgi:LysR family transcriptional activator of nhaA